jgi:hypothetical protein
MELASTSRLDTARTVLSRCQSALSEHQDLALAEHPLFDRADELLAIADDLHRFIAAETEQRQWGGTTPFSPLVELISAIHVEDEVVRRNRLLGRLENWIRKPDDALVVLDAFQQYFPALAFVLLRLVHEAGNGFAIHEQKLSGNELRNRLQLALAEGLISDVSNTAEYRLLRVEVLQFCLEEFADIDDVADALTEMHPGVPAGQHSWPWQLHRDLSLKCVSAAALVFWLQSGS